MIGGTTERRLFMVYTEEEARKRVVAAGRQLLAEALVARTWGNISARISEDEFIITPSGRAYETLREEDLVKCRIADCSYEGEIKPSSEKWIHADAYRMRPEANFLIHTHQLYATAVSVTGENYPSVPCAAYGMPSTKKLRKAVAECVAAHPEERRFLMRMHGAFVLGRDEEDAFTLVRQLEMDCKEIYFSRVIVPPQEEGAMFDPVKLYTASHSRLQAPIDDLAQIAGAVIEVLPAGSQESTVAGALRGKNAVLFDDGSMRVTGEDEEAVRMILVKGCTAALFGGESAHLGALDARLQRFIYVKKYSKQKGA